MRGLGYVVTHECDIHQGNDRPFNDSALVCPVIRFEEFIASSTEMPNVPAFLGELATRGVVRAVYVPPMDPIPYGGILYLNRITHTHVNAFGEEGTQCVAAVSRTGLLEIDAALQNLLMREKSEVLWGVYR